MWLMLHWVMKKSNVSSYYGVRSRGRWRNVVVVLWSEVGEREVVDAWRSAAAKERRGGWGGGIYLVCERAYGLCFSKAWNVYHFFV